MSERADERDELTRCAAAWEQAERDADLTFTLPGGVKLFARRIPATGPQGFWMGSRFGGSREEPRHRVVIEQDYFLGTFPVTQEQYRAVVEASRGCDLEASPSRFNENGDRRPVEQVHHMDATTWCQLLVASGEARLKGQSQPVVVRCCLPNEAQWERACRGGDDADSDFAGGNGDAFLDEIGWFEGNSGGETHAVGGKRNNGLGLFDMYGNVWEWCADVWDARAYRKRADGWCAREWTFEDAGEDARELDTNYRETRARAAASARRVVRGGSWYGSADDCRSAFRDWWGPVFRIGYRGFRVCLLPGPSCLQPASQAEA